jgi:23S rRNA-/tRNA-specific pseudouridylate synthase
MKLRVPPVLFEDEMMIAFDKPAGLLVAPDRWDKTLPNLMGLLHKRFSPDCFNVHRLDRDTSGVLLCARRKSDLVALCRLFESRRVQKEYLAIVRGAPPAPSGAVDLALAPDVHIVAIRSRVRRDHSNPPVYLLSLLNGRATAAYYFETPQAILGLSLLFPPALGLRLRGNLVTFSAAL